MKPLLQAVGKGGDAVIEPQGLHRVMRMHVDKGRGIGHGLSLPGFKPLGADEPHLFKRRGADLDGLNDKGIGIDKIPGIACKLAPDIGDDARRAEYADGLVAAEIQAQQMVKTDEVIDMGMGDKHVFDLEQPARLKAAYIAKVNEQGLLLPRRGAHTGRDRQTAD